jgi:GNAT superfamily N-acetyltransferase
MSVEFSRLDPEKVYAERKQFDCGHAVINKFVHDSMVAQVKKNLSAAYVLTDPEKSHKLVGFFTIAPHSIDASLLSLMQLGSLPRQIPCLRLVMLGVDKNYKGQDLGRRLMKQALKIAKDFATQIGGYGVYLDADPGAVDFYIKLGFALLEGNKAPQTSPMFIPGKSIA